MTDAAAPPPVNVPEDQVYELVSIDSLVPHPENPRNGDPEKIARSIRANGWYGTVQAQVRHDDGTVSRTLVVGEHRWRGAKIAGLTSVPCVWLDIDDARAKRIMLVDNASADDSDYNQKILDLLKAELTESAEGLEGTGFEIDDPLAEESPPETVVQEIKPFELGAVLLTYPLDRHPEVMEVLEGLVGHEDIEVRVASR